MLVLILSSSGILHAQFESFVLKDKYSGIESRKGKNYCEIEVFDSTLNIDSYVSTIYSTLAESYPHADIQVIGNSIIRMEATSLGIWYSTDPRFDCFVDFSIIIEAREYSEREFSKNHSVRVSAPVVKKLTFYNPYYRPDIKIYRTEKYEMYDALLESSPLGVKKSIAEEFLSEIERYIIMNIEAELNHYSTKKIRKE